MNPDWWAYMSKYAQPPLDNDLTRRLEEMRRWLWMADPYRRPPVVMTARRTADEPLVSADAAADLARWFAKA